MKEQAVASFSPVPYPGGLHYSVRGMGLQPLTP